jgi:hypothetical protein
MQKIFIGRRYAARQADGIFREILVRTMMALVAIAPLSAARASTLLGDVISGTYAFPCSTCILPTDPNPPGVGYYNYSTNPFVVDGSVETVLTVNGFATTNVMFSAASLVLTITAPVPYTADPFNGPEFTVLSGNSFGTITSVDVSNHLPVSAYISGQTLFVDWAGGGGQSGRHRFH